MQLKKKILVVDDDQAIVNITKKYLTLSGYTVFTAFHGLEALKILETVTVNLIMLDMMMPEMNGLEFLQEINENNITDAPILMVSGITDLNQRVECYKLGVYDFIGKPEHTEVILKRVENGLKIGTILEYNRLVKNDLLMASKLQKFLFPRPWAQTDYFDLYAWTHPVAEIGGDLYDYILLDDNSIIFFVSDVSGHGISASIFTAIVKMIFRNAIKETLIPAEVLTIMNREIAANMPIELFVTMFCGFFNASTGILSYANAGHPMPYLLNDGSVFELEGHGPFLGPIKEASFVNYSRDVGGSCLIVYTDGVHDIIDENENFIGKKLLLNILHSKEIQSFEMFKSIYQNILHDEEAIVIDDCTIVMLNFKNSRALV